MLCCEDLAPLVAGRPAEALARRVLPEYGGHIGRVLPSDWLPAPEAGPEVSPEAGAKVSPEASPQVSAEARPQTSPVEDTAAFLRRAGMAEAKIAELLQAPSAG
jgi:hypothetical protein